ncbi:MAG: response regulator [Planctomycetota bacterium]|nr:response regulator [Planctomycetota bacterium]
MPGTLRPRILVVDDNLSIHNDFRKILSGRAAESPELADLESALFGASAESLDEMCFEVDTAAQGQEGLQKVLAAKEQGRPYALAFVDIRMPPGWDGVETTLKLWEVEPDLEIVICTAYSDYSWSQTVARLGRNDRWQILKKPFDCIEVRQLASALSEKHRMRLEQRAYQEGLETLVQGRTEELRKANEALIAARDEALEAARIKSRFLANMSHELRTPLTTVIGYSDLLSRGALDADGGKAMLRTVTENCRHLLDMVNGLLDQAKIEAGMLSLEPKVFDLIALFEDFRESMALAARRKGIEFKLECDPAVPRVVSADPTRLRQILNNLAANAIKFTERGEVRVRVAAAPANGLSEERKFQLEIAVEDTGIGMAPSDLKSLFQPFQQAESGATRKYGGTGLGLVISRQLAQLMGGNIVVESKLGAGSRFLATLMLQKAPEHLLPLDPAASGKSADRPGMRGTRILLAEDNSVNQKLFSIILESAGAHVTAVSNGSEAVRAATAGTPERTPYDLVVMDMHMPEMDGMTATRKLRGEGYAGRIVALTASALDSDRRECLEAGCDAYITKPIDRATFLRAIEEALCGVALNA